MRFALIFFLTLSLDGPAFSQDRFFFQHITADDGLFASPNINIFQDREGYYWFSSVQGLQRYDGRNFVTYRFNYKRERDFSDNSASRPLEDRDGNIWVWNEEGICVFQREKATLERLYLADAKDSNTSNICNLLKDNEGRLWIITSRDILLRDSQENGPSVVYHGPDNFMHAIYDSKRNGIWLVLSKVPHAFVYFDCATMRLSGSVALSIDGLFGYYNPLSLLKFDRDNYLWIADYLGDLCRYDLSRNKGSVYDVLHRRRWGNVKVPNSAVFDLADDGSSIWFSTDNYGGIMKYTRTSDSFESIANENNSQSGLHFQNECNNMFLDREENVWVNTDMGLNIFNPTRQGFKYLNSRDLANGVPFSQDVTSFLQTSNGEIWISTWGSGIFRYDSNFRLVKTYLHHENDPFSLGEPLSKTWSLAEGKNGNIIVGCQYAVLSVLDPATGKFSNRLVDQFDKRTIVQIATDHQHNFWFGLHSGLLGKWDVARQKIFTIGNLYDENEKINHAIDGLYVDGNGVLWCAAGDDAIRYVLPDNDKVVRTGIKGFHPLALSGLGDSLIIGGSFGSGLFVYNKYTDKLRFFTTNDGMSSNTVYSAHADAENNIWVVTNESIERLDLRTHKVTKFGPEDGIRDHVFQRAAYKLRNGIMLVAANSGVLYFDPADIRPELPPLPAAITGIRSGQQVLPVDSVVQSGGLEIPFNKNPIAIDYGSLSFVDRNSLEYFYRLDGADTTWVSAGKTRSVLYANIVSGRYQFQVKCRNREGMMSPLTTLNIVIRPPWWRTWWAWLLWLSLAAAIALMVYSYDRKASRNLAVIRQKIASDLHDDIGSTLNSISVYSEVARQQVDSNRENAIQLLKKMGMASRSMIDNMNDIVWAVNPKNDQFEQVIERMQFFAAELLSGKNIFLDFQIDERAKKAKLTMEKRKNFYLIFKEAVTNAYKYSHAGRVTVQIATGNGWLTMEIHDDGVGFDLSGKSGSGNGLRNMQSRSKEVGADLVVSSPAAGGTTVTLKIGLG